MLGGVALESIPGNIVIVMGGSPIIVFIRIIVVVISVATPAISGAGVVGPVTPGISVGGAMGWSGWLWWLSIMV